MPARSCSVRRNADWANVDSGTNEPQCLPGSQRAVDAPDVAPADQDAFAAAVVDRIEGLPGVAAVAPPARNEAGDLLVVSVTPASDATRELVDLMRRKVAEIAKSRGITALVTGQTAINIDTADRLSAALPRYVAVVVGLALSLMMVVFRSILVPLKAAAGFLLSIGAAMGVVVWIFQDGHLAGVFNVAEPSPATRAARWSRATRRAGACSARSCSARTRSSSRSGCRWRSACRPTRSSSGSRSSRP